jgi:hypothetical protein
MFALACVAVLSGCPSPSIVYPTDKVPAHVVGAENWIPISNLDSSWNVEFDQVLVVSSTQLLGIGRVTNTALDTSALIRTTDGGKTWVYAPLIPDGSDLASVQLSRRLVIGPGKRIVLLQGFKSKSLLRSLDGETWVLIPTSVSSVAGAVSRVWITSTGTVFVGLVETLDCCSPGGSGTPQAPTRISFEIAKSTTDGNSWTSLAAPTPCVDATDLGPPRVGGGTDSSIAFLCRGPFPGGHIYRTDLGSSNTADLGPFPVGDIDFRVPSPFTLSNGDVLLETREASASDENGPVDRYRLIIYPFNDPTHPVVVFDQTTNAFAPGLNNLTIPPDGPSFFSFNHDVYSSTDGGHTWNPLFHVEDVISTSISVLSESFAAVVTDVGHLTITTDGGSTWCDISPISNAACRPKR